MITAKIETDLTYRCIERGEDLDYFIETLSYPIALQIENPHMSRIQFPKSRAILVRTSPHNTWVTLHIMRDVDLYSSFANFELDLTHKKLTIKQKEGYIEVRMIE